MSAIADTAEVARIVGRRMAEIARTRGPGGLAVHCVRNAARLPERITALLREIAYDRKTGFQTSRPVMATELGIAAEKLPGVAVNAKGISYLPTPAWALPSILRQLNISYPDYTFVDLGSGMGRAVFIAAEMPFAKVIGVEFSPELHRIAVENLSRASESFRAASIDFILQDAREYTFPAGNCVVYMFNPFQELVLRAVLDNLRREFAERNDLLYVIYFNPVLKALLPISDFLIEYKSTEYYSIYRNR
jgi:hypothetical protein